MQSSDPRTQVTQGEINNYVAYIANELTKIRRPPPSDLWHYTTGEGLIGILRSGTLWSTQISCLNDATEVRHAAGLLHRALEDFAALKQPSPAEQALYRATDEWLSSSESARSEWFVACFSAEGDDLSQWRSYGGGEGGYAIGFGGSSLYNWQPLNLFLQPVLYGDSLALALVQRIAQKTVEFFQHGLNTRGDVDPYTWACSFLTGWSGCTAFVSPVLKHPAFRSEQEWRLIRSLRSEDRVELQFRQRSQMLSRHLPLPPPLPSSAPHPFGGARATLPITAIRIGPSRHSAVSAEGVRALLEACHYSPLVKVEVSTVPFQST